MIDLFLQAHNFFGAGGDLSLRLYAAGMVDRAFAPVNGFSPRETNGHNSDAKC